MTATAVTQPEQLSLLREACQRNASAELHFQRGEADLVTARVRLLRIEEDLLYVDRPQAVGAKLELRHHQPVRVHFMLSGTRYAFRSRVSRTHCPVQVNSRLRVIGAALQLPADVQIQQRRADFRLSLAGCDWTNAAAHGGLLEQDDVCPNDVWRTKVRLVNISAGGAAVLIDRSVMKRIKNHDILYLTFRLPDEEGEIVVRAEVRHSRRIHEGLTSVVGLMFLPWSLVPLRPMVRRITRFIAAEQRRQLRRAR